MGKIIYIRPPKKKQKEKTVHKTVQSCSRKFRLDLMKNATEAEKAYGKYLMKNRIKFEFQKTIYTKDNSFYIVDFYIPVLNLIVEIDGGYHNTEEQIEKDRHRSFVLRCMGYHLIRISNEEVIKKYS